MCNPVRSEMHHEGDPWRHIWEPRWGTIPSVQGPKIRLLLANHKDELHGVCSQIRQVPMVFANIESPSKRAYIHDQLVAIFCLGNRLSTTSLNRLKQNRLRQSHPRRSRSSSTKTSFVNIESSTLLYLIMVHSSTTMNSKSSMMTSRSRNSSRRSHDLRPMGRLRP